ncbi:Uncharacterised protein [Bordetella pertussis]|nr:Uncharacterised protein [Bordetella pertussis]
MVRLAAAAALPFPPAGPACHFAQQIDGARIVQVAQAKRQRIGLGAFGQFVDEAVVRERIGQGRYAAQPGRAHDGGGIVAHHAQPVVAIRRHGRTVAHLQRTRLGGERPGQQQGQQGRVIGRIAGGEIVGGQAALRVDRATDFHQLRRALGLPGVLLLAAELHPHRPSHRARQQRGVGADIVGAIAAIAAGRLHADDLDARLAQAEQAVQVDAQHMGILRARPDRQAIGAVVGQPAGRADRSVHLVRPYIGAAQRVRVRQRRVHIALRHQFARRGRLVAQRYCALGLSATASASASVVPPPASNVQ